MPNFLDEYLIRLGAVVDESGMRRFEQAIRTATSLVDKSAVGMASSLFKAQTEIVGGFAAIGGAALGLVDKVAMADQEYRLFALHMYMSKDAARGLKVAMDALGQPLENLMWDPELQERTRQLIADQRAMAPSGDFEAQMRKIRDIRFEFTRMEVELQYLGMHVVQDFLKALGLGPDELLAKLQLFNDWVTHNLPTISAKIVTEFLPVWHDVERVGKAAADALYNVGVTFNNIVGLLSGDQSLIGTTLTLDKLADSAHHVSSFFATMSETISELTSLVAGLVTALAELSTGDFSGAEKSLVETLKAASVHAGRLAGGAVGTAVGAMTGHPIVGGTIGAALGDKLDYLNSPSRYVDMFAKQYGIDPALAHALASAESGERQLDSHGNVITSSTGAQGVMQLTRGTAAGLNVDRTDTAQNVAGGLSLLRHLLATYHGDIAEAVAAYHEGEPKMNAILAGKATLSPEARAEVVTVMRSMGKTGDVHIGSIVVHVDKANATNEDVGKAVADRIRQNQEKAAQRNMLEFQSLSSSY